MSSLISKGMVESSSTTLGKGEELNKMLQLSSGRDQISRETTWGISRGLKSLSASLQLSASIFSSPSTSALHHSLPSSAAPIEGVATTEPFVPDSGSSGKRTWAGVLLLSPAGNATGPPV